VVDGIVECITQPLKDPACPDSTMSSQLLRSARQELAMDPGRRRFFATALACGAAATMPAMAQAAAEADGRLTIGDADRGPSRFHPSFVKDVGLLSDLNRTSQGGAWWNFDTTGGRRSTATPWSGR
jgi:hypothetical protein